MFSRAGDGGHGGALHGAVSAAGDADDQMARLAHEMMAGMLD